MESTVDGDRPTGAGEPATIGVVVATRERPRRLEGLFAALRAQARPADAVVVVDDASRDDTQAVLAAELGRGELPLRVIRRDAWAGPATAREQGWRDLDCDLVVFTDDDCAPTPGWLRALARAAAADPGCFVQGRTDPDPVERARLGPFSHTISVAGPDPTFPTCNIAYPRELLERIGGFDTVIFGRAPGGEDSDLAWRAIEAGARPVFAPDARVHHAVEHLGPIGKLRLAARWTVPMTAFARHAELRRRHFKYGIFWKDHLLLVRALVSFALPARWSPLRNWLAFPYLRTVWARGKLEGGGLLLAPYFLLLDLAELGSVARAAIRTRTPML